MPMGRSKFILHPSLAFRRDVEKTDWTPSRGPSSHADPPVWVASTRVTVCLIPL